MFKQALISVIILVAAVALAFVLLNSRGEPEEKPKEETTPLVQVTPVFIRNGNLLVNGSGNVRARQEVSFAAEIAGKLIYVNPRLSEGARIAKGDILFRIEPADFRSAVQAARADVASQNVAVDQAREEVSLAKAEIARFEERRNRIAALDNFGDNSGDNSGNARILPPDALSSDQVTGQSTGQATGQRAVSSAPTNNLATRRPQLDSARAALRRAQAQLSDAQTALGRTVVRAPFSGVVRSKDIALGSFVQPGQALGAIVGTGEYEAVISLSEKEAALISGLWGSNNQAGRNQRAEASIFLNYGGTRYRWQAYVDRASSILNPQTRTIDIFLRIPRPINGGAPAADQPSDGPINLEAPPLFVGSFVDAQISGKDVGDYAELPLAALRPGNKIWLVRDGKLRIVDAQILQRSDDSVLISAAGLGANPMAIVGNLKTATEGEKVRVAQKRSETTQKPSETLKSKPKNTAPTKAAPES